MKTATRIIALGAAALITLGLASCGKKDEGFDYSAGLDKNGFFEGVKASDIITLPEYKGIDVDKAVTVAAEADVKAQIDGVLASYAEYEKVTDRAVKDGDTVNIDYVGSVGGVEFDGGSTGGAGTDATIGVTQYIDDFLEQLIGHKPGETFNVEVTFPEDYGQDHLNGKDAVFVTTINYIQGDMIEIELTDAIAADYGFATADEMVKDIEEWLIASQKFNLLTEILSEATCSAVPQSVMDYVINYDLEQYNYYASMYGMTVDQFLALQGFESKQAYIDQNMEVYTENATLYLAAQAIAELEGLTVTDEQIKASEYAEVVGDYGEPYIRQYLLFQEILPEFIVENGNVK
jgi:trigger factor